jgi:hypothetical protein
LRRQTQPQPQSPPQPPPAAAPRTPPSSDHSFAVDDDACVYFSRNELRDFSPSLQNLIEEQNNVDIIYEDTPTASSRGGSIRSSTGSSNSHNSHGVEGEGLQGTKDRAGGRDSLSSNISTNQQFWLKCLDEKENSRDDKPSPLGQDSRRFSLDGSRRSSLEEFRAGILPPPGSPHQSSPAMRSSSPASKTLAEKDGNTTPRDGDTTPRDGDTTPRDAKSPSKLIRATLSNDAESNEDNEPNLVDSSFYEPSLVYSNTFSFDHIPFKEASSVEVSRRGSVTKSLGSSPERLGALPRDAVVEGGQGIYAQVASSSEEDMYEPSLVKPKSVSLDRIPLEEVSSLEESDSGVSQGMRSSPERSGALPRLPFNEVSSLKESAGGVSQSMRSSPERSDALPRDMIVDRGQDMYTHAESDGSGDMYEQNLVKSKTFSFEEDVNSPGSEDSPMDLIEKLRRQSGLVDDVPLSTRSEESNELLSKPSLECSASSAASSPSSFVNETMPLRQEMIGKNDSKEEDSAYVESFQEQEAREELEYQEQEAREMLEYRGNAAQQEDEYFSPTSSYARSGLEHGPRFSDSGELTTSSSHRHLAFVESDDSLLEELKAKHELASSLRKAAEFSLMDSDEESEEETEEDNRELQYLYKENADDSAGDISGYLEDIQESIDKRAIRPYKDGNSQLPMDDIGVVGIDTHVYPNFLEDIPESPHEEHEHELEEEENDDIYELPSGSIRVVSDSRPSAIEKSDEVSGEYDFGYGNGDPPSNSGEVVVGAHRNAVDELLLEPTGTYESLVGIDFVTNEPINGAEEIAEPLSEARAELAPCVPDIPDNRKAMIENTPEPVPKPKVKLPSYLVDNSDERKAVTEDNSQPKANAVFSHAHIVVEDKEVVEETTEAVARPTVRYTSYLANVPDQSKTEGEERARFVAKLAANVESSGVHVVVEDKAELEETAEPSAKASVRYTSSYLANVPGECKAETEDSAAAAVMPTAKQVPSRVDDPVETKVELEDIAEPATPAVRYTSYLANVPVERGPVTEGSSGFVAKLTANLESTPVHIPIETKVDLGKPQEAIANPTENVESPLAHVPDETKVDFEETPELLAKPTANFESSRTHVPVETKAISSSAHVSNEAKPEFEETAESEAKDISSRVHAPVATSKVESEESTEAVPTPSHFASSPVCSSDGPEVKPVPTEAKMELETMSEPATTLAVEVAASNVDEEDPFEWAYTVWRHRGLMGERVKPSEVNVEKSWRKTVSQIAVPSSQHEELETIITPRVSFVESLNPQGVVADVPSDEKRNRVSFPVTSASERTKGGGKGFANVMQKWRDKSDGKPNTHFLSPESNAPMVREGDLPETTHIYSTESPRLANDTPVEKSFEPASAIFLEGSEPPTAPAENSRKPVSPDDLEKTEPRADFDALNEARADTSENFYFKAIKYHEKPGSKTENKGKKDLTKRQSLEIGSRPRFEGKESMRRQSYGGSQQTRQDAKRPSFETPLDNSNKGPTTQASKIKAAYNKQRQSIERQSIDQATKIQHEPKQPQSKVRDDEPTKSQHESEFQRHKSPPRSRVDFKTAIQTALRERVPDLEQKGDLQSFPSQAGHQVDDREQAVPVLLSSGAQAQSKKHSDVEVSGSHAESAKQGQNEAGLHRRGSSSLIKKESRSSTDIYGYNPSPKAATTVPMRDLVILEEEEDSEYDFDGYHQKRDVPRTVEVATDEQGIPMASSADDESVDERIQKPKPPHKRTGIRTSSNQVDQDYSPWTKKLVANLDEEQEDDQRITPREEAFSERPWRHDMVIERVKSYGEQSSQPPTEGESDECHCSNSLFSGNDKLVDFFLPLMGMACSCGKRQQLLENPEEPTALENILRPWQVDFLGAFGICRGDQLVKAQHRSAKALATALRQYRSKQDMAPFRTKSCAMAIQIWAKTCKAFVRSIRQQLLTGTSELKLPNTLYILSSFLEKMPGELDGAGTSTSSHSSVSVSREVDEADFL